MYLDKVVTVRRILNDGNPELDFYEQIRKYVCGIFRNHYLNLFNFKDLDDIVQDLYILHLENPSLNVSFLYQSYQWRFHLRREEIEFLQSESFTALTENIFDEYLEHQKNFMVYDKYFINNRKPFIHLLKLLNIKNYEMYLTFIYGESGRANSSQTWIKEKFFKNRILILKWLYFYGYISFEKYVYYLRLSKTLNEAPKQKRNISTLSINAYKRKYYELNKEKIKQQNKASKERRRKKELENGKI